MAVDVRSPSYMGSDTDAHFREWGQALGAALVACGLVKCSAVEVAGQINWATVLRPTSADQVMGYEVYKFNDALQATSPVFIKIYFGSSNNGGSGGVYPGVILAVVNGAINGTGDALVGATTSPNTASIEFGMFNQYGGAWANGTFQTSGGPNRIAQRWMLGAGATAANQGGYGVQWGVERTKNADGSDNGDGVIVQAQANSMYNGVLSWFVGSALNNGGGFAQKILMNNGDNAAQMKVNWSRAPLVLPPGRVAVAPARSGIFNGNTAIHPWILPSPRGYENPGMNFVGVWNGDIGINAQFLARMYGADHNFRMGNYADFIGGGWFDDGAATGVLTLQQQMASAMRWE